MLNVNELIGFGVGGRPREVLYKTYRQNGVRVTPQSFIGVDVGLAEPTRLIVVTIGMDRGTTGAAVTGVTIGGVTATVLDTAGSSGWGNAAMAYAVVPTGTTADISVTFNFASSIVMGVYAVYGLENLTHVSTARNTTAGFTLTTQPGDLVIVTGTNASVGSPPNFNIAANDYATGVAAIDCSGAHATTALTSTVVTIDAAEECIGCAFR